MSDEDYVDKHLKRLVEKGPDTLASLRAEVARLRESVAVAGRLFAASRDALAEVNAENERLRAALESIADLPPGYADMRQDDLVVILASKARAAITQEVRDD